MPRANPNASFKAAAKHLSRHLHDAAALRHNPLARAFFGDDDRSALASLHHLFRTAAERCRDADLEAGKGERARRQFAIAVEDCLERKPPATLAAALGISGAQYYRDRADVCLRICAYIRDRGGRRLEATFERFDDCRFGIGQASSLAEIGEVSRAIQEYERLLGAAPKPHHKIEILCEIALARLRGGLGESARDALREAETLLAQAASLPLGERAAAEARTSFVRGMCTWPSDPPAALALLESALHRLQRCPAEWTDDVRALYVRILFEFGEALTTFSKTHASIETLASAARLLARCPAPSPVLALKLEITTLALRMSMLVDPCGWETVAQRLEKARDLGRRAMATGSVDLNLAFLNVLSQLQARSGEATAALGTVRSALRLWNYHPSREIFSEVTLRMARTLLYTPLWREVPNVLRAAGAPATVAVASSRKTLLAEYALRNRGYAGVAETFSESEIERRPYVGVLVAGATHALGDRRRSRALIERALPDVEKAGVALTIGRTYEIAGRVMNERSYARKAAEIRHGLSV